MYVETIDPNIGPSFGGTYIKVIGNGFGTTNASNIKQVTIDGKVCEKVTDNQSITNNNTSYYCILPETNIAQNKYVDIVVTDQENNAYSLNQTFEYVKVSRNPISGKVESE
jgi:hypothetical protein